MSPFAAHPNCEMDSFPLTVFDGLVLPSSTPPPPPASLREHDGGNDRRGSVSSSSSSSSALSLPDAASEGEEDAFGRPPKRHRANVSASACSHPTRLLRFDPSPPFVVYVRTRSDLSPEEVDATWWSCSDYDQIRESAKAIGRKVREREGFTRALDVAYDVAGQDSATATATPEDADVSSSGRENASAGDGRDGSVPEVEMELEDAGDDDNDVDQEMRALLARGLAKWSSHGHACRGLEKFSSMGQLRRRTNDSRAAIRAVLEEQTRLRCEAAAAATDTSSSDLLSGFEDFWGEEQDGEGEEAVEAALRAMSIKSTRRARRFARMIGDADAAAVVAPPPSTPSHSGRRREMKQGARTPTATTTTTRSMPQQRPLVRAA